MLAPTLGIELEEAPREGGVATPDAVAESSWLVARPAALAGRSGTGSKSFPRGSGEIDQAEPPGADGTRCDRGRDDDPKSQARVDAPRASRTGFLITHPDARSSPTPHNIQGRTDDAMGSADYLCGFIGSASLMRFHE